MQLNEDELFDDGFDDDVDDQTPPRPRGVRFGEGQPINRTGRPPGSPNMATMAKRVATQRHNVVMDGKKCRKTTLELVILQLRKMAAEGDPKAFKLLQIYLHKLAPRQERQRAVFVSAEKLEGDEWAAIYGFDYTDEEVEDRFPYLMPTRRHHQQYRDESERCSRELEEANRQRKTPL